MASVNKVIIVGNLGRDPEIRYLQDGTAVGTLSVATSDQWMDKNTGEKREKTEWHRVIVWRRLAEICGQYLSKGRQIYIEGKLQTREWEDKDGIKRYTTEIQATTMQMLGGRQDGAQQGGYQGGGYQGQGGYPRQGGYPGGGGYQGGGQPYPQQGGYQQSQRQPPQGDYYQGDYSNESSGYQGPGGPSSGNGYQEPQGGGGDADSGGGDFSAESQMPDTPGEDDIPF